MKRIFRFFQKKAVSEKCVATYTAAFVSHLTTLIQVWILLAGERHTIIQLAEIWQFWVSWISKFMHEWGDILSYVNWEIRGNQREPWFLFKNGLIYFRYLRINLRIVVEFFNHSFRWKILIFFLNLKNIWITVIYLTIYISIYLSIYIYLSISIYTIFKC